MEFRVMMVICKAIFVFIGKRAYNQEANRGMHTARLSTDEEPPRFEFRFTLSLFDIGLEFHYNK